MKFSQFFVSAIILLSSCVTPFDVKTDFHQEIVVQGMITDQPGPYLIKISKTLSLNDELGKADVISGATVTIYDDLGNSETLRENSPGNYSTNSFQGVVGRSYWIKIIVDEGNIYQSSVEKLLPVGDFSNLSYEFRQNEDADANLQISSTNGFNIFLDSEVLPEQENRVWWRWTGTFEISTHPELQKKILATNPPVEPPLLIPDAPPCSGYFVSRPNTKGATAIGPLAECQCCTCWVNQYNQIPLISNPKFISNGQINKLNIGFIEANRRTFYNKYYFEVEQLSISQEVYDFWTNVIAQKGNSSNLFQTPPPKTRGNIVATTPNSIPAVGYFAVSASKKHGIFINRDAVPYYLRLIDTLAYSCQTAYKYSSTKKPLFW